MQLLTPQHKWVKNHAETQNFFQAFTPQNDVSKPKKAKSIKKVVTAKNLKIYNGN